MIIDFLAGYARICSPVFLCPAVSIKKQRTVFFKTIRCFFLFLLYFFQHFFDDCSHTRLGGCGGFLNLFVRRFLGCTDAHVGYD